jgi:hypothetical protein
MLWLRNKFAYLLYFQASTSSFIESARCCIWRAGLMTAAITRNERYHQFYAIFFLLQTIVISLLIFQTLV